ncbi:hypothetical protein [Candidatus Uabimicrobium sp. HlEnr_7]|uniref:hypothetical protein n=1 Tax=Candidatus Uabimicrobium helgolandensis TaxID=3095367 RepID=UPI003556B189
MSQKNEEIPNPEFQEKKLTRRKRTIEYKKEIIKKVDALAGTGKIGAFLRKEGLYYAAVKKWRGNYESGKWEQTKLKKTDRKIDTSAEITKLKKEKEALERKLKRAELIIEAQKKISQILELSEEENDTK